MALTLPCCQTHRRTSVRPFQAQLTLPRQPSTLTNGDGASGDPVKKRRILWGWSTGGPPKALPRELTYHPTLQSIVQQPVAELDELHEQVVAEEGSTMLAAGEEMHISDANATDAVITFKLPSKSAVFGFATQGIVSADGANRSVLSDGFIISINCAPPLEVSLSRILPISS